nr:Tx-431 [Heteropoda pingtungensis]
MKIAIVMTLLLVAFSTASLAIVPIERAARDLLMARGKDTENCKKLFGSCETSDVCCEGWYCNKGLCKYRLWR